jgi:hypothetical protein
VTPAFLETGSFEVLILAIAAAGAFAICLFILQWVLQLFSDDDS